ncbi:uncharacterized protein LOC129304807 [Prosopis cineraria]|uniref:uncharacterized protein LOC129304807 n=1 Tax=Prosopis cineraria TaxID=364024 RepID=UPI00240F3C89|nr:uncharacterized protein LOC129304807 [Prosopis cineraria]
MERVKVTNLLTIVGVALLALVPKMESQHTGAPTEPRPLCASQYALANYACVRLPFTPGTPPSPPSRDDDHSHRHRHGHGHGHRHRHRHHHHHHHHHTSQEENCCRWVREVDSQCVCEVLLHLPPFLVRPLHQYTVTVGDFCNVTYSCGGPI